MTFDFQITVFALGITYFRGHRCWLSCTGSSSAATAYFSIIVDLSAKDFTSVRNIYVAV